jgi:hypothetical protein
MKPSADLDKLSIALYQGSSAETIPIEQYRALATAQRAALAADTSAATVALVIDGRERLAHQLSLGCLKRLAAQFAPAILRLRSGLPALIRSGVLDVPEGHYLLLEPAKRNRVDISWISIDDLRVGVLFPDGSLAAELYRYVAAHRDDLIDAARSRGDEMVLLPMDRDVLIAAMTRTAEAAIAVLAGG